MPDSNKRIMVGAPPVKGSEAEKAGLKIGDYIVAVNGVETKGRTAFDIIDQISEQPNAEEVTFKVLTQGPDDLEGEGYIRDVTMKRQFVEVKNPITYKITEKRKDGTIVGYIRISEFNSLVKPKLEEALKALTAEGANALGKFYIDAPQAQHILILTQ
jgi:C-terminal processing protease CtpA/Prc